MASLAGRVRLRGHGAALIAILAVQVAGNGVVSPLRWGDPVAALSRNESIQLGANIPAYPENLLAYRTLDLSGFSQAYWGAASHPPMAAHSFGVDLIAWLLRPRLCDPASFFRVTQIVMFLWCVAGSFGFYLFLLEGLGLSRTAALAGGLLYLPSNPYFGTLLASYFPFFSGAFLTVPWVLLVLARSRPFLAGLVFCLNLYILPSHPEMEIGAFAVSAAFAAYLAIRRRDAWAVPLFLAGTAAASALYALPMLETIRARELAVFGHRDGWLGSGGTGGEAARKFFIIRSMRLGCWAATAALAATAVGLEPWLARLEWPALAALALMAAATGRLTCAGGPDGPDAYRNRPDFEIAALLEKTGARFSRFVATTPSDHQHVGAVSGGYLLNNAATSVDTRFLSAHPQLQSLYLIPGERYESVGHYDGPMPWSVAFESAMSPRRRKLWDIAGIDGYVVGKDQFEAACAIADLRPLASVDGPPRLVAVRDERSYGLAYLARKVRGVAPIHAAALKDYLALAQELEGQLLSLGSTHDAIIEGAVRPDFQAAAGTATVENVFGNKAAFTVACEATPCVLVFNTAALSGWRAFVDAAPAKIRRANFAFLSVEVPRGVHLIWFEHRLSTEMLGAVASLLAYAVGFAGLLLRT